jgi:hypothetical protein
MVRDHATPATEVVFLWVPFLGNPRKVHVTLDDPYILGAPYVYSLSHLLPLKSPLPMLGLTMVWQVVWTNLTCRNSLIEHVHHP